MGKDRIGLSSVLLSLNSELEPGCDALNLSLNVLNPPNQW